MKREVQLLLPTLEDIPNRAAVANALVEVVLDERGGRARVRPLDFLGWVRFPKRLREPGAVYRVETLRPLPGGAWAAVGKIQRVRLGKARGLRGSEQSQVPISG